jgi:hypothetical protein
MYFHMPVNVCCHYCFVLYNGRNTRRKPDLHVPSSNLTGYHSVDYTGIKLFNTHLYNIKIFGQDIRIFKPK